MQEIKMNPKRYASSVAKFVSDPTRRALIVDFMTRGTIVQNKPPHEHPPGVRSRKDRTPRLIAQASAKIPTFLKVNPNSTSWQIARGCHINNNTIGDALRFCASRGLIHKSGHSWVLS
jgi:hypothetical protein